MAVYQEQTVTQLQIINVAESLWFVLKILTTFLIIVISIFFIIIEIIPPYSNKIYK